MKKISMVVAALVISAPTMTLANDCSFMGGQFERVARASNTAAQVRALSDLNLQLEILINVCGGAPESLSIIEGDNSEIGDINALADVNKGACDASTISGQAKRAIGVVNGNNGAISGLVASVSANVGTLSQILLTCTK